jgi:hypothetical protein
MARKERVESRETRRIAELEADSHTSVIAVRRLGRERTRSVGEYRADGVDDDGSSTNA